MTLRLVLDDTLPATPSLHDLIGVHKFGALVFQRRTRAQTMAAIAEAAGARFVHLQSQADMDALADDLRTQPDDALYMLAPAYLAPMCGADALTTFLRQVAHSPNNLRMPADGPSTDCWALLRTPLLRQYLSLAAKARQAEFFETHNAELIEVRDRLPLIDIRNERALLDFLSGQLDARHFNDVSRDDYTVVKRSADRVKLKREFEFYHHAPPAMQMFLVQPFDFKDDGATASYRMERLSVPDMALQWVHGALNEAEFARFLDHIFYFIKSRPERSASPADVRRVQDDLYIEKVQRRLQELKAAPGYAALAPLLDRACGGVDALFERYQGIFARLRKRLPADRLALGHGDPCFSNILYSKTNQYLKLIDPRGAEDADALYTDAVYDIAKLSHSVLGDYDFINQGKFDILVDERLRPTLAIEDAPPAWARRLFLERIASAGLDPALVRACEASLFISMLPLHMDRPQKVLGFAIRGASILDELSPRQAS